MATTEVFLCPSASRQRDGLAWDLPPHVLGGVLGMLGFLGQGGEVETFHFYRKPFSFVGPVCGVSCQAVDPRWHLSCTCILNLSAIMPSTSLLSSRI